MLHLKQSKRLHDPLKGTNYLRPDGPIVAHLPRIGFGLLSKLLVDQRGCLLPDALTVLDLNVRLHEQTGKLRKRYRSDRLVDETVRKFPRILVRAGSIAAIPEHP
jgi:hypothetical protein